MTKEAEESGSYPPITKRFSTAIISAIIIVSKHNTRTGVVDYNRRRRRRDEEDGEAALKRVGNSQVGQFLRGAKIGRNLAQYFERGALAVLSVDSRIINRLTYFNRKRKKKKHKLITDKLYLWMSHEREQRVSLR